ncbi:MAG: SIS domain-containing protein [Vicinamibacterales bacterium]
MADIHSSLADARALLDWLTRAEDEQHTLSRMTETLVTCLRAGGRILSCGNGGSMCDAMHFAEELSGRNRADRPALSAQAMSDPGHLTCVANDYGFEQVFARGVEAWARAGDVLLVFSTSGNSRNLIRAAEAARGRQVGVVGLLGRDGGALKGLCDLSLIVPGITSDRIQEIHIKAAHLLIEGIEHALFPRT